MADPLEAFHAPTRAWFQERLGEPTGAQSLAWPAILRGETALLSAPTGSGKTLAAFLVAIDRLMWAPEPPKASRCKVLYVSPLKALAVDVEKNLRAPLAGIEEVAARMGLPARAPTVMVRTGDTPAADRARMRRSPPEILITTPESLFLILTSGARNILRSVETVIVDEIHSLVATKRGAHLFVSLERLEALEPRRAAPLQRIGLSATQRPLDEVARLLGGFETAASAAAEAAPRPRPVTVLDASAPKPLVLAVEVPDLDMSRIGERDALPARRGEEQPARRGQPAARRRDAAAGRGEPPAAEGGPTRSIWPYLHEHILPLLRAHRSTMIFVNSRRLAERLAAALNAVAGEELVLAHHGSVARDRRAVIEERLKRGDLKAIVATSSLELGIDMGAVDLVIQVEPPPSVASGLQRIGRAGHSVSGVSHGVILPKHRGELLAAAAAVKSMRAGDVEATFYPRNPLDVLAQQVVAICAQGEIGERELFALVRRAAPFETLPRRSFEGVLDMLSGRYASDDFAGLVPRVVWDRKSSTLVAREGAARVAIANGGTIPDRGLFGVFLADGGGRSRRVGELDEEMVFELREGEVFLLGASSWRVEEITTDRVLVSPAPGQPGKMPFWHGDRGGRPLAFGLAVGRLARELAEEGEGPPRRAAAGTDRGGAAQGNAGRGDAARGDAARGGEGRAAWLAREHALNDSARRNLVAYVTEQVAADAVVPSDEAIVVERGVDETGSFRVCVLSPRGSRVHAPWCAAILARLAAERGVDTAQGVWSDDGMVFRLPETQEPPPTAWFLPGSREVERTVTSALAGSSLFASHFRECASRALLLPRRRPGQRTPLWAQRKRAADLLAVASRHPDFPILLETYRECLNDVYDMPGLIETLRAVEEGRVRVSTVDVRSPSPFAASLLFSFAANFIYEGDGPLAERRALALAIDHDRLRELLGEAELRDLLDPRAIDEHARLLARLDYPARNPDELHHLLQSLGDLSLPEIEARAAGPAADWLSELASAGRVFTLHVAGELRHAAIEDAGKLRDALGVAPPDAAPEVFLAPHPDALAELVTRYARTHAPFTPVALGSRWGLAAPAVARVLDDLVGRERLLRGEFLPGGRGAEYSDPEVLRAIRQKSLARRRRAVEPVPPAAYARFLVEWQRASLLGRARPARRADDEPARAALLAAIQQLEGYPVLASALEADILPARVPGFRSWELDALCSSGEIVWAGVEPVGSHDGRIVLYLAGHEPLLAAPAASEPPSPLAARILELLGRRGAIFFSDIVRELGGFGADVSRALHELIWKGEVRSDTLAPLRAMRSGRRDRGRSALRRPGRDLFSRGLAGPGRGLSLSRGAGAAAPGGPTAAAGGASFGGYAGVARSTGPEGRWSLRHAPWTTAPGETDRRAAIARMLLERYGVVTREALDAENVPGGFGAVYDVFKTMEQAGRIRRGYFIEGRGPTQFALPGADDRLRALRDPSDRPRTVVLAASDPANPYGAALPWPPGTTARASTTGGAAADAVPRPHAAVDADGDESDEASAARPQRSAGALVLLHDGELIGWLGRGGHALLTFLDGQSRPAAELGRALAAALVGLVESGRTRVVLLRAIDGDDPRKSPVLEALTAAGFVTYGGHKGSEVRFALPREAQAGPDALG